jgi:hypothetical protein
VLRRRREKVIVTVAVKISRARTEWIGFKTIVIREFGRIVRIWGQTILPPAVTATLYFIIFGSLIGRRVSARSAATTTCSSSRPA